MLTAAVKAGADAVYLGVQGLNMRIAAANFSIEDMPKVIKFCHENKVKVYCTINIIIFEKELLTLDKVLPKLKKAGVDAVICWDLAVIKKCKELGIETHLSTQASVSNSESAKLWKEFGVSRIVLARECSLEDVKEIKEKAGIEIETFIHGARCISLSGRCFMSEELYKKSANRGECLQPCRRQYRAIGDDGKEMVLENNFIMSAKDLCALPLLPKLQEAGVISLKIEGRNRGAEYVSKVVSVYREALDAMAAGNFSEKLIFKLTKKLEEVYNKGFTQGFYVDYPHHMLSDTDGNKATTRKVQIGKVSNYYDKISVAEFKVESEGLKLGNKLGFLGDTTGYYEQVVEEIHDDNGKLENAEKGMIVSVKLNARVRIGDKVFLVKNLRKTTK
jgi:U32 family peptidase